MPYRLRYIYQLLTCANKQDSTKDNQSTTDVDSGFLDETKPPEKEVETSSIKASHNTQSAPIVTDTTLPALTSRATNKICDLVLRPILAKPEFKPFHPLVVDCPRRIKEKEILCLRDLEKTLLLSAPVSEFQMLKCALVSGNDILIAPHRNTLEPLLCTWISV